jgi:hypothetical protein
MPKKRPLAMFSLATAAVGALLTGAIGPAAAVQVTSEAVRRRPQVEVAGS